MNSISNKLIDDQNLVARYLANQLTDAERERFEAHFLEHPETLQELNRTAQFKAGLAMLKDAGMLESSLAPTPWWRGRPAMAAAASLVLALLVGFWISMQQPTMELLVSSPSEFSRIPGYTPNVANSFIVQRTRTTSYDATFTPPKDAVAVELRVRPETLAQSGQYRVTLSRVTEDNVSVQAAERSHLKPDAEGLLPLYLSSKVQPGIYELRVYVEDVNNAARDAGVFLIEVEKPAE